MGGLLNNPKIQEGLGGLLHNPSIQQSLGGILGNISGNPNNVRDLLTNPSILEGLVGILGGAPENINTPRNSVNDDTSSSNSDDTRENPTREGTNLLDILQMIAPGVDKNTIETIVNLVKTTPQEELGELCAAFEESPNALKDFLGLDTNIDPSSIKLILGMVCSQIEK